MGAENYPPLQPPIYRNLIDGIIISIIIERYSPLHVWHYQISLVGIDTNVLVYAHDKSRSAFHERGKFDCRPVRLQHGRHSVPFVVGILCAVITDGRKLRNPLRPSEACAVMAAAEFNVLDTNSVIRAEAFGYAEKARVMR